MANTDSHLCIHCLEPLIYMRFTHHYCLVCDNSKAPCYLFRQPQMVISRDDGVPEKQTKGLPSARVLRPDYQQYRTREREAYQFARSLCIPSTVARDLRNKNKDEIMAYAGVKTNG